MGKLKNLVTEVQEEFTLTFDDAMAVTNKVLQAYATEQGVGSLFDDLRSVVDQYRGENTRLQDQIMALESEIAMLQQSNAAHERFNASLNEMAKVENGIEIPNFGEGTQPTEWR